MLARDAWVPQGAVDLVFLAPVAGLFAEVTNGRIPEERWQEVLRILPTVESSPLPDGVPVTATNDRQPTAGDIEMEKADVLQGVDAQMPSTSTTTMQAHHDIPSQSSAADLRLQSTSIPPPVRSISSSPASPPQVTSPPRRAQSLSAVSVTGNPRQTTPVPIANAPPTQTAPAEAAASPGKPNKPRPKTSGKSMEYLAKLGLVHRPRITLTLKRGRETRGEDRQDRGEQDVEPGLEDAGIDGDDDDDDYVLNADDRPKKKRRAISAPMIEDSDEDLPKRPPVQKPRLRNLDDWPTYPSPEPCTSCITGNHKCLTFVLRPKGWKIRRQRRACANCYLKKKKCLFTQIYKEQQMYDNASNRRQAANQDSDQMDTDGDSLKQKKGKAKRDDADEGWDKPSKNKGKTRAEGHNDHRGGGQNVGEGSAPQRPTRSRQVRYRSGESGIARSSRNI